MVWCCSVQEKLAHLLPGPVATDFFQRLGISPSFLIELVTGFASLGIDQLAGFSERILRDRGGRQAG